MPYSKDPHKYPPQMAEILAYLMEHPQTPMLRFEASSPSSANGRRIQVQSYFKAVERHAQELAEVASKVRQRALAAAGKNAAALGKQDLDMEYREAQALAETWEERALIAKGWLAKAEGSTVVIARRSVDDTFAASIAQVLAAPPTKPVVSNLEEQLALLALAEQQRKQAEAQANPVKGNFVSSTREAVERAAPQPPALETLTKEERMRQGRYASKEEMEEALALARTKTKQELENLASIMPDGVKTD